MPMMALREGNRMRQMLVFGARISYKHLRSPRQRISRETIGPTHSSITIPHYIEHVPKCNNIKVHRPRWWSYSHSIPSIPKTAGKKPPQPQLKV